MNELPRDSMRLSLAAELRELRRSLAELEAVEDAARQRFERVDAAFLWNQRVLAPVVCFGVEIMSRRGRGGSHR